MARTPTASDSVTVNPTTGATTHGRTPLNDIVSPATVKRLQDHGYNIVHSADPAPAPAPAPKRGKKTAKRTAKPTLHLERTRERIAKKAVVRSGKKAEARSR